MIASAPLSCYRNRMKTLFVWAGTLLLIAACASKKPPATLATSALASNLAEAHQQADSARQSSGRLASNLNNAKTDSSRVDAKASVVLRWLKNQP